MYSRRYSYHKSDATLIKILIWSIMNLLKDCKSSIKQAKIHRKQKLLYVKNLTSKFLLDSI